MLIPDFRSELFIFSTRKKITMSITSGCLPKPRKSSKMSYFHWICLWFSTPKWERRRKIEFLWFPSQNQPYLHSKLVYEANSRISIRTFHFFDEKKKSQCQSRQIFRSQLWRHFVPASLAKISSKSSKMLDFSLLSLPCEEKFWISELESEKNKVCWEQLSMRSLRICNSFFLWKSCFKFCFPYLKFEDFGIFSSGDVEHPT